FRLFPELVGRSSALAGVLDLVKRAAPRDTSVVIFGESGTGKELIGRAIHRLSARREQPFVTENCGALTESLLESELFGHEKGAFTGASSQRAGLFERANRGTVFLDEIGEMSAGLQTRLLRVLQERELRRVGGTEERSVDFRLIAATHRNLDDEARHGRFRLDLLYRMDVIRIRVPPLRERPEDIPALVSHFIEEFTTAVDLPPPVVPAETLRVLRGYPWPGNIRELRNEIERAVTLDPEIITPESLSPRIEKPPLPLSVAQKVRDEVGTNIYGLEKMVLGGIIREILTETGGNKTRAAQILGLPKTSLYRRMKRYGID
ncbi:MAG: sigma-54 dependent transcriptional regulator, partial [Planctomycetota bacterium]